MPLVREDDEFGSYRTVIENTFLPQLSRRANRVQGRLAVIYDKNHVEATGYAATMAELTDENVLLAPWAEDASDPPCRFRKGILQIRDASNH